MAKSEIIALLAENGVLRGVRYVPRGRDSWVRTGGGEWTLDLPPSEGEYTGETESPAEGGTVAAEDTPLARALREARNELGASRVVVALPLSKILAKVFRVPVELRDDLESAVALQMDKLSPFPGEDQAVGCEVLSETESELWVFAAAIPVEVFNELADPMHLARFKVVRTDVAALGWYRSLCGPCQLMRPGRRILLMNPNGEWDLMVLDHGVPVLVRGLGQFSEPAGMIREVTLSVMNAEIEAGIQPLEEILVVSGEDADPTLCEALRERFDLPVTPHLFPSPDGGVEGVALRAGEGASMDLTPQSWRSQLREQALSKRITTFGIAVASVALLFMGVMFAGPAVYRQMTQQVRKHARQHAVAYKRVSDTRERVKLIQTYTDRTYSPLEVLRKVSEYLPEGVTFSSLTYKRTDSVKIAGVADQPTLVYDFKNEVTGDPLFSSVSLTGPSASKGKHKFDINAVFVKKEETK